MKRNKFTLLIRIVLIICLLVSGGFFIYVSDYYHADENNIMNYIKDTDVNIYKNKSNDIIFEPDNIKAGMIFYPGGKVECSSYIPLMEELSSHDILCILVEMPFNLAVFDMNAADKIIKDFPDINEWYIGGHSLGGAMAASHLYSNLDDYKGLILLGSYSTADFTDTDISVLSVYGSQDKVMNKEKYNTYKSNLPSDYSEVIIEGGNHAYFGMYGKQKGDGVADISNSDQIRMTTNAILNLIEN